MASIPAPTMFRYSPSQVPTLEGEHYDYRSSEMENFFVSEDVWEVVEKGMPDQPEVATQATQKQHKENKKKDTTTLRYIKQRVNKSIYPRIFNAKSAKEAWDVLKDEFQGNEKIVLNKSVLNNPDFYETFLDRLEHFWMS